MRSGVAEGAAAARAARLRYVSDRDPGYSRARRGRGFVYRDPGGKPVRDRRQRARLSALAIPPAWTEVWICPHPTGHIQATGRDEAGRKQYIYHPRWQQARDRAKYERILSFGRRLPRIRRQVDIDLRARGLPRRKVLAAVLRLLETSRARVGNDEYARRNASYGLTTIRKKHVGRRRRGLVLEFDGKGGKPWRIEVRDRRVQAVVRDCLRTPGHELFKYRDDDGQLCDVTSADVNAYLREIAGAEFTAKDFRTWAGTVLCALALRQVERSAPEDAGKKKLLRAIERVASELGNTPAISRQAYIHPRILDGYTAGQLRGILEPRTRNGRKGLSAEEAAVLGFLRGRLRSESETHGKPRPPRP